MAVTREELDHFHHFAEGKLGNGGLDLSWQELLDLWLVENPSSEQHQEDLLAVNAALRDMANGDTGEPAEDVIRELRQRHNIPTDT